MNALTLYFVFVWFALGWLIHWILTGTYGVLDTDDLTTPQLIFLRFLCGPAIWVYGFWGLLGMWGRRS